jgi:uncharacterized Fe-S cluster-containing protein
MNEKVEQRLERAEAILGTNCATCPHKRLADMPTDELEKLIADEMDQRLEALPYEEAKARLSMIIAKHEGKQPRAARGEEDDGQD